MSAKCIEVCSTFFILFRLFPSRVLVLWNLFNEFPTVLTSFPKSGTRVMEPITVQEKVVVSPPGMTSSTYVPCLPKLGTRVTRPKQSL